MLRRPSLEWATFVTLVATIVAVACASSWSVGLRHVALPARDLGLVLLCALALAQAARRGVPSGLRRESIALAALLALAIVSAAWSVDPRATLGRGAAFGLVLVAAQALGFAVAGNPVAARRLLWGVLAAAAIVALAGLATYALAGSDALQPATGSVGARYRGIGQSPNTLSMLFAVGLPLAGLAFVEHRSRGARVAAAAAFALLAGSIGFSGSRGALAAALLGLAVLAWCVTLRRAARFAASAAIAVLAAALVGLASLPQPLSAAEAANVKSPVANTERYTPNDAEYKIRLEDEVGYAGGDASSGLFRNSGRVEAWRGAIRQGEERPALGYGFGTEARVFVDRYAAFQGGLPENSFVGLFLQLGIVGVAALVLLLSVLAVAAVRALRVDRGVAAAGLAVLVAGVVLAFVQSYVYAFGNVATLAVWLTAFVAASTVRPQ